MIFKNGDFLLSASDLMRFMSCRHATSLDLRYAKGEDLELAEDTEDAKILQKYGDAHEAGYLAKLKAEGRSVIEFDRNAELADAAAATQKALALGPDVVFQGALFAARWGGWSDFLIRSQRPSSLGAFSYEVVDTKLKRRPDPKHILQLVLYSDLLAQVQQCEPERAHVELGNGERFSFRLKEYAAYARQARLRLEEFVTAPPPTSSDPVKMCELCRWRDFCQQEWEAADSLVLVAGISKGQRKKLLAAGVDTMTKLGQRTGRVPKLSEETARKLATQARLQSARRAGGAPSFELKPFVPERGFALLPKANAGDVFYDIEGDPFFDGGLEYLHGLWFKSDGQYAFSDYWAHDRRGEGEALRRLFTFFSDRFRRFPGAHAYHYAAYEVSALRRLSSSHGIGEAFLDQMLRENRFVDLYKVVTGALFASEPSYSLKNLEAFYMEERSGDVKTAGGSVIAYERWRETKQSELLDEIREYNKTDCVSTQRLRDWLVSSVRPASIPWREVGNKGAVRAFDSQRVDQDQAVADGLRNRLRAAASRYGGEVADLLYDLTYFHRRERKPRWWSIFDKIGKEVDDLVDDLECIGGLVAESDRLETGKSWECTYRFPKQETKLEEGECHVEFDGAPAQVSLVELDHSEQAATVRFPKSRFDSVPEQISLLPRGPLKTDAIESAIERVVESFIVDSRKYPAIKSFILKSKPRFKSSGRQAAIVDASKELIPQILSAIGDLDGGVLPIQGPPGTGKTYVSSCAILDLARQGKRVAVTSNSHKAIDNLLFAIVDRAKESRCEISIAKKGGEELPDAYSDWIQQVEGNDDDQLSSASVVGGTAWLLSRKTFEGSFDYLFIDEAGQVSIANTVAMSTCAKNVVLVGDPMQLAQPVQGVHPGQTGASSLEYLHGDYNTVPEDRGIFLPVSRRMHPSVCRFISDLVYEGRLTNDLATARQQIFVPQGSYSSGAHLVEVAHVGNSQTSPEEVARILATFRFYLRREYVDREGNKRPLGLDDILVVAPYNLQVNALKAALPPGARVGTVDKFQGQEAPICLVSMTTSSADEIPRGIDFLFSLNRINVAISRAQVLCLVFASARLLEIPCSNVEQMRLVNSLCALKEYGDSLSRTEQGKTSRGGQSPRTQNGRQIW